MDAEDQFSSGNLRQTKRKRYSKFPSNSNRFSIYIFKVLKQVHPTLAMTKKAMKVMDDFMNDIFVRLVTEAASLVKYQKKSTLSSSEFQTATRLILPGELAKHAVNDATKAVASFIKSKNDDAAQSRIHRLATTKKTNIDPSSNAPLISNQNPVEIEIFAPEAEKNGVSNDSESELEEEPMETDEDLEPEVQVITNGTTVQPSTSAASKVKSNEEEKYFSVEEELENLHKSLETPENPPTVVSNKDAEETRAIGSELIPNIPSQSPTALANVEGRVENHPTPSLKTPLSSNMDSNSQSEMESEPCASSESTAAASEAEGVLTENQPAITKVLLKGADASLAQSEEKSKIGEGATISETTSGLAVQTDGNASLVTNTSLDSGNETMMNAQDDSTDQYVLGEADSSADSSLMPSEQD